MNDETTIVKTCDGNDMIRILDMLTCTDTEDEIKDQLDISVVTL